MIIKLLKDRNIFPDQKKAEDIVEIEDTLAKCWIDKEIAVEIMPEVKPNKNKKG